jgi:selenide,water dikinase
LPISTHPDVITGLEAPDDCGVIRVREDLALVTTVDAFTPVVDDPYDYGRIAAINSLSDIYAMGARPISALSVAGFPDTRLPLDVLAEVLRGLVEGAAAVGVPVLGGHTVKNPEPLFGLAVTGIVHPDQVTLKGGGRVGDLLVLTKPLGIGVMTTAIKNERLSKEGTRLVTELMLTANARAAEIMVEHGARAATDVTGFGLLGHLLEMAEGAGLGAEIDFPAVPVLDEALEMARLGLFPGGARTNYEAYLGRLDFDPALEEWQRLLLADPQTSGGLLICFAPERLDNALEALRLAGVPAAVVGRLVAASRPGVVVKVPQRLDSAGSLASG